ncbi:MAG: hypothetical protein Ct9H300mP12_14640 [Acidimicrobiales bacterium]|nr:MAG: hypothetical protein Ct9H300mP12_14640 [Acidimicrobiales bacterium]
MDEVAILGVGMHPWGKWGRSFTEYGVHAAREALADADIDWNQVGFVSGAITVRCGYPGYVAGSTFARRWASTGPKSPAVTRPAPQGSRRCQWPVVRSSPGRVTWPSWWCRHHAEGVSRPLRR